MFHLIVTGIEVGSDTNAGLRPVVDEDFAPRQFLGHLFAVGHVKNHHTAAPSGFGCPCHGGQYDPEGNRTAGPPVRALDRYEFSIVSRNLVLNKPYSVAHVTGTGANAKIQAYPLTGPGQHVDGVERWLYPIQPPGR